MVLDRPAGRFLDEQVGHLERLGDRLPVVVEIELHVALLPAPVKPLVVGKEGRAGSEGQHQAVAAGGLSDGIGCEEIRPA